MPPPSTRYRILECLGEGGFGVVYRARLTGPQGFEKDVALKLLRADPSDAVIARFRDEARILGLVRDRAIVSVDPPALLDGRWALVMEYVEGASGAQLLRRGPVPPSVALEIVGEVGRALDVAYRHQGPDGRPLFLVHRDLKPANLQITATGQVKILDFGVARATFDAREVATTMHVAGTPAYMAPERLRGVEEPAGDIYSLGVVLHELVTGRLPAPPSDSDTLEVLTRSDLDAVMDLGRQMRDADWTHRPTAREVEERCEALRARLDGPSLRNWAEQAVPAAREVRSDHLVGHDLSTTSVRTRRWPVALLPLALIVPLVAVWLWPDPAPPLEEALRQPFLDLVMETNARVSERSDLREPDTWDRALYDGVVDDVRRRQHDHAFWQRVDQVWSLWSDVTAAARQAGLPEVVAGVPWVESQYKPELQSPWCAKGLWQFMPEPANRGRLVGAPLRVRDCRLSDTPDALWSPTDLAPPNPLPYVRDGECRIPERLGCLVDDRADPALSTATALALMQPAWHDREIRASGAAVQLTLATHFAGYEDAAWGHPRPSNVRPAWQAWAAAHPPAEHPRILGAVLACSAAPDCITDLQPWVVEHVIGAIGAHLAAVCFYAKNYPEHPTFSPWVKYTDGYCGSLDVPTRAEVATVGPPGG